MKPTVDILGVTLTTYSLLFVAGLYLALALFVWLAPRRGLMRARAFLIAVLAIIGGLVGARLLFVITQIDYIVEAVRHGQGWIIWRMLAEGGLVFFGGLIGGILTSFIAARTMRVSVLALADAAAPAVALGQAIGRLGCHFAGCCYGLPHDRCGIVFPEESLAPAGIRLFPTQLTESLFMLLFTGVLLIVFYKTRKGYAVASYLSGYGLFRFLLEFMRGDRIRGFLGPLSTSQWIALAAMAAGVLLFLRLRRTLVAGRNDG